MRALDRLLESPRRAAYLVALLAVALRLIAGLQLHDGPHARLHRWSESDMAYFLAWADRIAGGDVLSSAEPRHPLHGWHLEVAAAQLGVPVADLQRDPEPAARLWDRWYGGPRLHQEPLYPYGLAALRLLGLSVPWILALQLVLGVWTVVLIQRVARRHAGPRAGLLAALLALGYAPMIAFELALLRTALVTALGVWLVDAADRARAGESSWASAGLVAGLSLLAKATFAPLVVGLAVLAGRAGRRPLLLFAGVVVALQLPLVARNLAVGAPALSSSSVGAITFASQSVPSSTAGQGWLHVDDVAEVARAMDRGDGGLVAVAWHTLAQHDAGSLLRMIAAKASYAVWWYEIPNNVNPELPRRQSVLGALPVDVTLLAALALLGLPGLLRRGDGGRRSWPLALGLATAALPLVAFYVLARFRVPLAALLCPVAAAGVVDTARALAQRRWASLLGVALAGALLLHGWRPLPAGRPALRPVDLQNAYEHYYRPEGAAAVDRARGTGDYRPAFALIDEVLALVPAPAPPSSHHDRQLLGFARDRWLERARLHRERGAEDEAREALDRAKAYHELIDVGLRPQ